MNPVLLPKRKEFGFLKPPSAQVSSSMSMNQQRKHSTIDPLATTASTSIPKVSLLAKLHSHHQDTSNTNTVNINNAGQKQLNYVFDPLKVKYELSNHLFGQSFTHKHHQQQQQQQLIPYNSSNQFKSDYLQRQAYRGMSGSNVRNQIRRHQILSVPINFNSFYAASSSSTSSNGNNNNNNNNNSSNNSKHSFLNANRKLTKIDASHFLQQLMNKRKEKTMISQNCRTCGINYFENNRCLYCEYNNSTNVVWLPNLARQQFVPTIEPTNNKQDSPDSSNKTKVNQSLNNKQPTFYRLKTTTNTKSKRSAENLVPLSQQQHQPPTTKTLPDQREKKVKSTASDYYGDSTLLMDEMEDSFENNNINNSNPINNSYITTEFNLNQMSTNKFQPYDENYKYHCSINEPNDQHEMNGQDEYNQNNEDGDDDHYRNVVPKLTLWLV